MGSHHANSQCVTKSNVICPKHDLGQKIELEIKIKFHSFTGYILLPCQNFEHAALFPVTFCDKLVITVQLLFEN